MQGLVRFTGKSYEDIRKDLTRDLYLTSVEAVEYGLIDKVMQIHVPGLPSFPLLDSHVPSVCLIAHFEGGMHLFLFKMI